MRTRSAPFYLYFHSSASWCLFTYSLRILYMLAIIGTPSIIPEIPNQPPLIILATNTQIPGRPIEEPTTLV